MGCGSTAFFERNQWFLVVCHLSQMLEFVAFAQTEVFYLRLFEITAAMTQLTFVMAATKDVTDCHAVWSILQIIVNVWRILTDQAKVQAFYKSLPKEDVEIHVEFFENYSRLQFVELSRRWSVVECSKSHVLLAEGSDVFKLRMIVSGSVDVSREDKFVGALGRGQFIGEMSYFTDQPASASVTVSSETCRILEWDMLEVRSLSKRKGHSASAQAFAMLPAMFCRDLVSKVVAENANRTRSENDSIEDEFLADVGAKLSMFESKVVEMFSKPFRRQRSSKFRDPRSWISPRKDSDLEAVPELSSPLSNRRKKTLSPGQAALFSTTTTNT